MTRRILSFILIICIFAGFASCGEDPTAAKDEDIRFRAVASFYPVYVAAANLTEGASGVSLTSLLPPEYGCLHDFTITTKDMKSLYDADLFIASGLGMEPFLKKTTLGVPGLEVFDSSEGIESVIKGEKRDNPHYWLNIENAIVQVENIERVLCELNPENFSVYKKNAESYKAKLHALLEETQARISALPKKEIAVLHNSFDYFADEFGIKVTRLFDIDRDTDTVSAKELSDAVEYIRTNDIKAVFADKSFEGNSSISALCKETGCEVYVLDTVTSGEFGENTKDAYINAVRENLSVLEEALNKEFVKSNKEK